MALLAGDRFALLVAAAGDAPHQQVLFDRDETDSYRIQLEASRGDRTQLSRAEVMPALPVGSRWADAIGWESYVLFPVAAHAPGHGKLVIVGLEYVVEHPTRGAYAVFGGVVVPTDKAARVALAIADQLDPAGSLQVAASHGVVISGATSLAQHRRAAAWILRAGGAAFAEGTPRTVRTVLLTSDELPRLRSLVSARGIGRGFLLGVVPPLRDHFSGGANKILGLLGSKWFPAAS